MYTITEGSYSKLYCLQRYARGRSNVVNASSTASRKSRAVVYSHGGTELCGDVMMRCLCVRYLLLVTCYLLQHGTVHCGKYLGSINS